MDTTCIYHRADLDGWVSAAIVKTNYPDAELIGYNYGEPVPVIPPNNRVIICDIALEMDDMKDIADNSGEFIWIDHHISSIRKYEAFIGNHIWWTTKFPVKLEPMSACELTWEFFNPDTDIPKAVRLLGMYDTFRHVGTILEATVFHFQLGAQSLANDPKTASKLIHMTATEIEQVISDGKIIYRYNKMNAASIYAKGVPAMIEDKVFILFNVDHFNPPTYGINYHLDGFDGAGYFRFDGQFWRLSLTNDDNTIDCSAICAKYGGGGHFSAAGAEFTHKEFFKLLKKSTNCK